MTPTTHCPVCYSPLSNNTDLFANITIYYCKNEIISDYLGWYHYEYYLHSKREVFKITINKTDDFYDVENDYNSNTCGIMRLTKYNFTQFEHISSYNEIMSYAEAHKFVSRLSSLKAFL